MMLPVLLLLLVSAGVARADKHDGLGMAVGEAEVLHSRVPSPSP
eukprot:COSAG06_NODE_29763_length_550_cov_3.447894_1_plen_43_part_10